MASWLHVQHVGCANRQTKGVVARLVCAGQELKLRRTRFTFAQSPAARRPAQSRAGLEEALPSQAASANSGDEATEGLVPAVPMTAEALALAAEAEAAVRKEVVAVAVNELTSAYIQDLQYTARNILLFRKVADTFEWLSLVLSALGSITAFMAGVQGGDKWWAFAAGATGSVSLAVAAVGRYCNSQSKERTSQLNKLLTHFGITNYPDVVVDFSTGEVDAGQDKEGGKCKCKEGETVPKRRPS